MSRTPTRFKQHRVTTTRPMNCYAKVSTRLGRSRHRFFSLPSGRGQPFVTRSPFNRPYGRQGCVLAQTVESNQDGRFDGNESVADSFRSGAVSFKTHASHFLGAFPLLRLPEKNLPSESELATRGHPFVHSFPVR
ncbi:hypothetical protein TNCV_2573791 [Trichonephila clavipes]|nr:hypothetical protein TNCV_2573791 [Trichonephila clavipes]